MSPNPPISLSARLVSASEAHARVVVPGRLGATLCWGGGEVCVPVGAELLACLGLDAEQAWTLAFERLKREAAADRWVEPEGAPGLQVCVPSAGEACDRLLVPEQLVLPPGAEGVCLMAPARELLYAVPLDGPWALDALAVMVSAARIAEARSARPLGQHLLWFDGHKLRPVRLEAGAEGLRIVPDRAFARALGRAASRVSGVIAEA